MNNVESMKMSALMHRQKRAENVVEKKSKRNAIERYNTFAHQLRKNAQNKIMSGNNERKKNQIRKAQQRNLKLKSIMEDPNRARNQRIKQQEKNRRMMQFFQKPNNKVVVNMYTRPNPYGNREKVKVNFYAPITLTGFRNLPDNIQKKILKQAGVIR